MTFGSFWQNTVPGLDVNADIGLPWAALGLPLPGNVGLTDLCVLEQIAALRCVQSVGLASAGLGDNFVQLLFQNQEVNSQAIFFQADYDLTDKLTVTGGLRWTREEKEFQGAQSYLAPLSVAGQPPEVWAVNASGGLDIFDDSSTWREWTPKVGADYRVNEDVMFYGSYSEGFHSGGYFGRNQNVADFANTYEPEFAKSYEAGMKAQFLDNTVQFNAAIFFNDFEGKQEATIKLDATTDTVVTVIDNVGNVEYLGAEFELRWVVNERFNIFASLGLLDAEYQDLCVDLNGTEAAVTPPMSDCGVAEFVGVSVRGEDLYDVPFDESDKEPKYAPKRTFGVGGTYTIPIGAGYLDIHARYNSISKQESDLGNAPGTEVDSADFIHASATYSWDRYRLTLYGRNLTDERRETTVPVAPLFQQSTLEPGRSWGVEFDVNFGQ